VRSPPIETGPSGVPARPARRASTSCTCSSAPGSLEVIEAARAEGLRLTVETCPHYLCFSAEQIPDASPQFKCCPPIRDVGNREELWGALRGRGDRRRCQRPLSGDARGRKYRGGGDLPGQAWGGVSGLPGRVRGDGPTKARRRGIPLKAASVSGLSAPTPPTLVGLQAKGQDRGRRRRRPRGLRHRRRLTASTRRDSRTAIRSPPTTDLRYGGPRRPHCGPRGNGVDVEASRPPLGADRAAVPPPPPEPTEEIA